MFPKQRKGPRCPELTGKVPLIVWESDDERATRRSDAEKAGVKRVPDRVGSGGVCRVWHVPEGNQQRALCAGKIGERHGNNQEPVR